MQKNLCVLKDETESGAYPGVIWWPYISVLILLLIWFPILCLMWRQHKHRIAASAPPQQANDMECGNGELLNTNNVKSYN